MCREMSTWTFSSFARKLRQLTNSIIYKLIIRIYLCYTYENAHNQRIFIFHFRVRLCDSNVSHETSHCYSKWKKSNKTLIEKAFTLTFKIFNHQHHYYYYHIITIEIIEFVRKITFFVSLLNREEKTTSSLQILFFSLILSVCDMMCCVFFSFFIVWCIRTCYTRLVFSIQCKRAFTRVRTSVHPSTFFLQTFWKFNNRNYRMNVE